MTVISNKNSENDLWQFVIGVIWLGQKVKLIKWSSKMGWIWIGNHKNVTSLKWSNVTYSWTGNFKSLGIRILNHLVKFLNAYNSTNHSQEINFLKYRLFNSCALRLHSRVKMTMTVSCLKNSPDSLRKNSLKLEFLGFKYRFNPPLNFFDP